MIRFFMVVAVLSLYLDGYSQLPFRTNRTQYSTGVFEQGWNIADSGHVSAVRDTFNARYSGTRILRISNGDTSEWFSAYGHWFRNLNNKDALNFVANSRYSINKGSDSLQLVNDISVIPAFGQEYQYGFDSTGLRGFQRNKYIVSKKYNDLRGMRSADTSLLYRTIVNGIVADFYWSPISTSGDDSVMCLKLNGVTTGRLLRYFENNILVDWFGAVPNDGLDDSYYIQKAINFALTNSKAPQVIFSGGTYLANDINIVNKSGDEYSFVTLKISGASFLIGNATTISVNNVNGFGFHIMVGRQVEIDNINFIGQCPHIPTIGSVITWTRSDWAGSARDNINSPHAAIVIDGYSVNVTSDNRYPGMSTYYSNSGTGGTSQLTIKSCSFKQFVTAIIEGAAGYIANGDNIKASECYFENNRIAWACGQTQSRANSLENCYFLFHQFILNGTDYGSQQGTPPNVKRCNIAGATKYLYSTNGSFGSITFEQCYSESLFSLGKNLAPVQFTDCELIMNADPVVGFQAFRLAEGDQVSFKGGRFGYFDNLSKMAVAFDVKNLSFNGVTLLCLPVNINSTVFDASLGKTVYDNCHWVGSGQSGDTWEANTVNTSNYQTTLSNSVIFMPGYKVVNEDVNKTVSMESKSSKIEIYQFDTKSINIDTPTATAYFIATNPNAYQVYDVLTTPTSLTWSGDNSLYTAGGTIFGEVYAISSDTIRIKYVPFGLDETTSYPIYVTRVPHFVPRFFGNLSSGANQITSAVFPYFQPLVGDWIKGAGLPDGTRITNIYGATITLSRNALSTQTGIEFHDAKVYTEVITRDVSLATQPLGFSKGDIIVNNRDVSSNDSIAYWICKTAGVVGGSPAAEFTYVPTAQAAIPFISSGTSAPSSTPNKIGDIYVDVTSKKIYIATGTTNSADWTILN